LKLNTTTGLIWLDKGNYIDQMKPLDSIKSASEYFKLTAERTALSAIMKSNWHLLRKVNCLATTSINFMPAHVFLQNVIKGRKRRGLKWLWIHHKKKKNYVQCKFVTLWSNFFHSTHNIMKKSNKNISSRHIPLFHCMFLSKHRQVMEKIAAYLFFFFIFHFNLSN